jgi:hypothetical protein
MNEREKKQRHEAYSVAVNPVTNRHASLCGIFNPSTEYIRVTEAELALELLG